MPRRGLRSWDWLNGSFANGNISIEGRLPYMQIVNNDVVAHVITLTGRTGVSNLQQTAVPITIVQGAIFPLNTEAWGTAAIDVPTAAVQWWYSSINVATTVIGTSVLNKGRIPVSVINGETSTAGITVIYTVPPGYVFYLVRFYSTFSASPFFLQTNLPSSSTGGYIFAYAPQTSGAVGLLVGQVEPSSQVNGVTNGIITWAAPDGIMLFPGEQLALNAEPDLIYQFQGYLDPL